jgi:hypothetical protein
MKSLVLLLALSSPGVLLAQQTPAAQASPTPAVSYPSSAFSVPPPDEGSVFFAERQEAKFAMTQEGQELQELNTVATYPRSKESRDSVAAMFSRFFTDMFASVKMGRLRPEKTTQTIEIEPSQFSLGERRELDATYTVRNNTNRIIRLDFNTTQRVDILTFDPSGKVVEKWSEDRLFMLQEGVIIINPKERIEYTEQLATRERQAPYPFRCKGDRV